MRSTSIGGTVRSQLNRNCALAEVAPSDRTEAARTSAAADARGKNRFERMLIGRDSFEPAGPIAYASLTIAASLRLIVYKMFPSPHRPAAGAEAQWPLTMARNRSISESLVSKEHTSRRKASSSRGASAGGTARELHSKRPPPPARKAATREGGARGKTSLPCRAGARRKPGMAE